MRLQNKNIDRTVWKLYGTSDMITSLEFMTAEVKVDRTFGLIRNPLAK